MLMKTMGVYSEYSRALCLRLINFTSITKSDDKKVLPYIIHVYMTKGNFLASTMIFFFYFYLTCTDNILSEIKTKIFVTNNFYYIKQKANCIIYKIW